MSLNKYFNRDNPETHLVQKKENVRSSKKNSRRRNLDIAIRIAHMFKKLFDILNEVETILGVHQL